MDIFDGTIWHRQAIFMIKILPILRCALDGLFHEGRVVRMNPLENELYGRFRRWVVFENSEGFLRPKDRARGHAPAEAPRVAEPLSFRQVRSTTLQFGSPFRHLDLKFAVGFPKLLLAVAQRFLGSLPVSNVGTGAEPFDNLAFAVPNRQKLDDHIVHKSDHSFWAKNRCPRF